MTFKHVKFEDSVVMRSLEKLAKEQGLVKEEPITKTASANLTPTNNLTENVLTLCAGLRARGLHKQAGELESKFLTLKQAQTLYETSKEKGEDLIDAAHPKGSHKLEDVDGDEAVFETILDQHLKNMKMVEKEPTGKLASSRDVLRAVKIVLAQDSADEQKRKLRASCIAKIQKAYAATQKFVEKANVDLSLRTLHVKEDEWGELVSNPTVDRIKSMQSSIESGISTAKPGWSGGVTEDTWTILQPFAAQIRANLAGALADRQKELELQNKIDSGEAVPQEEAQKPKVSPAVQKIQAAKQQLNGIAALVRADTTADPEDVKDVNVWIGKISAALKDLESNANEMAAADVDAALAKLTKDFVNVRGQWA